MRFSQLFCEHRLIFWADSGDGTPISVFAIFFPSSSSSSCLAFIFLLLFLSFRRHSPPVSLIPLLDLTSSSSVSSSPSTSSASPSPPP